MSCKLFRDSSLSVSRAISQGGSLTFDEGSNLCMRGTLQWRPSLFISDRIVDPRMTEKYRDCLSVMPSRTFASVDSPASIRPISAATCKGVANVPGLTGRLGDVMDGDARIWLRTGAAVNSVTPGLLT